MKIISNEEYTVSIEDKVNDVEVMMSDKMENINKNITSYTIHQDNHTIINIVNKDIDKALRIESSEEDKVSLVYNECFNKTYVTVYGKDTRTLYFNITDMNNKCTLYKIKDKFDDIMFSLDMMDSSTVIIQIVLIIAAIAIMILFRNVVEDAIINATNDLINQLEQLEQMN